MGSGVLVKVFSVFSQLYVVYGFLCVCFSGVFPECVAKGSRLTWESEGRAVFAGRCFRVRNRPQPFATVRKCSNPAPMALPLGRALKRDFSWTCHVSVCAAIPL